MSSLFIGDIGAEQVNGGVWHVSRNSLLAPPCVFLPTHSSPAVKLTDPNLHLLIPTQEDLQSSGPLENHGCPVQRDPFYRLGKPPPGPRLQRDVFLRAPHHGGGVGGPRAADPQRAAGLQGEGRAV